MRVLVAGWFSFEIGRATAGDLLVKDVVCAWLEQGGCAYDVAVVPPFKGDVNWRTTEPSKYTHVVFICGPFQNTRPATDFLARFAGRHFIGVNLSMLAPVEVWNPFDLLLERDSSRTARPDLSFVSRQPHVPTVGIVLVHPQPEYGKKGRHDAVNDAISRLLAARDLAAVLIDTRLDRNSSGLGTAAQVESLIGRMDAVITTRLHGLVLALKNGVPALAVDPVAGGAKIRRQSETIGWPVVFTPESISDRALEEALNYCLTEQARNEADRCRKHAMRMAEEVKEPFLAALTKVALESEAVRTALRFGQSAAPSGPHRLLRPFLPLSWNLRAGFRRLLARGRRPLRRLLGPTRGGR